MPGSGKLKCDACGSTDIDVDPSRADAVCTNCGNVLESSIIVSDIQFEENAHGGTSAIGTFVSAETRGGGMGGASSLKSGGAGIPSLGRESREVTLRNARKKIEALAHQLSLRRDRIDMAFHFFKLALARNLTKGRKSTHTIAACVYITCRTEGTSHMLIDFSDVLQIDVYELGRTYLRLSQALHINIPAMDPCLYVMRFAHKLEFEEKTHEVSMTALRLVSRMKKDWMHQGRRPSGLCGAALLIASRLHGFSRSVQDVLKVVKVHESTLRKRLNEFGETPTSQLTLDEFANVDLDAMTDEQDPPSFKAARKRDRERLMQLEEEGGLDEAIDQLGLKIEEELEKMRQKVSGGRYARYAREPAPDSRSREQSDEEAFVAEETLSSIQNFVNDLQSNNRDKILMPPPKSTSSNLPLTLSPGLGLKDTVEDYLVSPTRRKAAEEHGGGDSEADDDGELDLTGIDDGEIDGYLMTAEEVEFKTKMWNQVNADYLKEKAEKEERERIEAEEAAKEGREVKKKVKRKAKSAKGSNATAIEAIEKIIQEKKISTKINYDVLRNLACPIPPAVADASSDKDVVVVVGDGGAASPVKTSSTNPIKSMFRSTGSSSPRKSLLANKELNHLLEGGRRKRLPSFNSPVRNSHSPKKSRGNDEGGDSREVVIESGPVINDDAPSDCNVDEFDDDDDDEDPDETAAEDMSVAKLLSQHQADGGEEDFNSYAEEEEYY